MDDSLTSQGRMNDDTVEDEDIADIIVIGSGIGGLSCAALLAHYGKKVRGTTCHPAGTSSILGALHSLDHLNIFPAVLSILVLQHKTDVSLYILTTRCSITSAQTHTLLALPPVDSHAGDRM